MARSYKLRRDQQQKYPPFHKAKDTSSGSKYSLKYPHDSPSYRHAYRSKNTAKSRIYFYASMYRRYRVPSLVSPFSL